ncbi:hypothetical protein B0H10DRAFT_2052396 [Mycena sp. CBHHK59/15]|nr:hypothetical protein B0H10DRAFT_2052396 [Mycena sp. CBHHK59/15]
MYATNSTTVPTVQHTAAATVAAPVQKESSEANVVNHNGPQCCHCGWRGGSHASNCPFK